MGFGVYWVLIALVESVPRPHIMINLIQCCWSYLDPRCQRATPDTDSGVPAVVFWAGFDSFALSFHPLFLGSMIQVRCAGWTVMQATAGSS